MDFRLQGQCTSLEKSYFRLSGRPDPKVVRPEPVLEKALDRLINLYRKKEVTYFYANDQFKVFRDFVFERDSLCRRGNAAGLYSAAAAVRGQCQDL